MERSEWFDDDDESSPQTPPEDRVWRHPSELGSHGPYGAPPRRRHALRFAGALALGSAGTLAFAVLTSMHLFGGDLDRAGGFGVAEGSALFRITAPTSLVRRATTTVAPTLVATTETTTPVVVTSRTVASMPPKVGISVSGADNTVPAVIDDDGFILTGTDDLAGAHDAEVVLDDGTRVAATVESVDASSGVTRLKPASKVPVPANQTMAWLGVTCSDDTMGAPPPAPNTTTTATVAAKTSTTSAAPTTTTNVVRGDAPTVSVVSTAPAPPTVAPSTTAPHATTAPTTVAAPTAARPTDVAPSTTADERPRVVATSVPSSVASTASTGPAPATTTGAGVAVVVGVRVHHVHEDSPAALAGLREGDMIVAVDQRAVRSRWALVLAVRRHAIGDRIVVEIVRDGAPLTFDVALTAGPTA